MDAQTNRSPAGFLVLCILVITAVMAFINGPQLIQLAKDSAIPVTGELSTLTPPAPTSQASAEKTRSAVEETTRLIQAQATQVESQRQLDQGIIRATEQAAQATRQSWQATSAVNWTTVGMSQGLADARSTQIANKRKEVELMGQTRTMEAAVILAMGVTIVLVILALTWSVRTQQEGRAKEAEAAALILEQQRLLDESRRQASPVKIEIQPQRKKNGHYSSKIPARIPQPEDGAGPMDPPISYAE